MPLMRPPSNDRTAVPILTAAFLLHAEKNAIRTETVRCVGFNEFLQYTSFHKLLLIIYIISSLSSPSPHSLEIYPRRSNFLK